MKKKIEVLVFGEDYEAKKEFGDADDMLDIVMLAESVKHLMYCGVSKIVIEVKEVEESVHRAR